MDPLGVDMSGQVGSLIAENAADPSHPLDLKFGSGPDIPANRMQVNLRPITHPADLPPICMMNWLVLLEERKSEYYTPN
jgi:hypothetical protein